MWTVSNIKALLDLKQNGISPWSYEALYFNTYSETRRMLSFLGIDDINIHPSYLFLPSMSTLKTFHADPKRSSLIDKKLDFFWKDVLSESKKERIIAVIKELTNPYPDIRIMLKDLQYL